MATVEELRTLCDRHQARGQEAASLIWTRPLTEAEREAGEVAIAPGLRARVARPHFGNTILSVPVKDLDRWLRSREPRP